MKQSDRRGIREFIRSYRDRRARMLSMVVVGDVVRLGYGLYVHRGLPSLEAMDRVWNEFSRTQADDLWHINPP
jgi:hypothetical protein